MRQGTLSNTHAPETVDRRNYANRSCARCKSPYNCGNGQCRCHQAAPPCSVCGLPSSMACDCGRAARIAALRKATGQKAF